MTTVDRLSGVRDGLGAKAPVRLATTVNIALTGLQTIDGALTAEGDRVLVKDQSIGNENGLYNASSGNWTRTLDFNGSRDVVSGTLVYVSAGDLSANLLYSVATSGSIVIGETSISFVQVAVGLAGSIAAAIFDLKPPRVVTGSGTIIVADDDATLIVNKTAPSTTAITLPTIASRDGAFLSILDFSSSIPAGGHTITLTPQAGETIERQSAWSLFSPSSDQFASVKLRPVSSISSWMKAA